MTIKIPEKYKKDSKKSEEENMSANDDESYSTNDDGTMFTYDDETIFTNDEKAQSANDDVTLSTYDSETISTNDDEPSFAIDDETLSAVNDYILEDNYYLSLMVFADRLKQYAPNFPMTSRQIADTIMVIGINAFIKCAGGTEDELIEGMKAWIRLENELDDD